MTRRFQFSLRWLMVLFLVLGAFFGGIGLEKRLSREELAKDRELLDQRRAAVQKAEAWIKERHKRILRERYGMMDIPGTQFPMRTMPQLVPQRCPICGKVHEAEEHIR